MTIASMPSSHVRMACCDQSETMKHDDSCVVDPGFGELDVRCPATMVAESGVQSLATQMVPTRYETARTRSQHKLAVWGRAEVSGRGARARSETTIIDPMSDLDGRQGPVKT